MDPHHITTIEKLIFNKQYTAATYALYQVFISLRDGDHFSQITRTDKIDAELTAIYTRLANCLCNLFLDYSHYQIDMFLFTSWIICARELRAIFTISGFYRTDFMIDIFNSHLMTLKNNPAESEQLVFRILLFSMLENKIQPDFIDLFKSFPSATFVALLSLLSAMVVVTPHGAARRETLLNLVTVFEKQTLPDAKIFLDVAAVWMLCSYASRRDKHAAKFYLNKNIRLWLDQKNIGSEIMCKSHDPSLAKPTLLIILEWFGSWHAMGRSYGAALKSLRERFHLIGIALQASEINDKNYTWFDEMMTFDCYDTDSTIINAEKLHEQLKIISQLQPDLIFYPSIGMHPVSIIVANLRLAPIQMMSFGHPASSFCDTIDYGIIEADYALDDETLFSEKMILLPPDSFILQPLEHMREFIHKPKLPNTILRIGITSSLPKISSHFLQACKKISESSKRKISFWFFLNETEIFYLQCKEDILRIVPDAQVLHRLKPDIYLHHLQSCDLYLSTFPFGGANSVIDAMCVGLPIVCLRGDDIAARTDSALIRRRGLPEWLVAHSEEEYISAALRLIHQDEERLQLREMILARSIELFPEHNLRYQQQINYFSTACWKIYQHHHALQQSAQKSFSFKELNALGEQHGRQ